MLRLITTKRKKDLENVERKLIRRNVEIRDLEEKARYHEDLSEKLMDGIEALIDVLQNTREHALEEMRLNVYHQFGKELNFIMYEEL